MGHAAYRVGPTLVVGHAERLPAGLPHAPGCPIDPILRQGADPCTDAPLVIGLQIAARLRSVAYAQMLQLLLEYDPQPPFQAGSPAGASAALTDHVRTRRAPAVEAARQAALVAQQRLKDS